MDRFETIFRANSCDILSLSRTLFPNYRESVLRDYCIEYVENAEEDRRFKKHPESLSSLDSDLLEDKPKIPQEYHKHELIVYEPDEQTHNVTLKENTLYLFSPRSTQKENYSKPSQIKSKTKCDKRGSVNLKSKSSVAVKLEVTQQEKNVKVEMWSFEQRLDYFLEKTLICLGKIDELLINGVVTPDGEDDWDVRRTRSTQFVSRIQRNYLYSLELQITQLENGIKKQFNYEHATIQQHIIQSHITLFQTFQCYQCHVIVCLGELCVDQLTAAIRYTKRLITNHKKLLSGEDMKSRKLVMLRVIQSRSQEVLAQAIKVMSRPPYGPRIRTYTSACAIQSKLSMKGSKLTMYSVKRNASKKSIKIRTEKTKTGPVVQSRYKTSGFKHRPPVERKVETGPIKPKVFTKKSINCIKYTPLPTPKNDDNIKTMIGTVQEEDEEEKPSEPEKIEQPPKQIEKKEKSPTVSNRIFAIKGVIPLVQTVCDRLVEMNEQRTLTQKDTEVQLLKLLGQALHETAGRNRCKIADGFTKSVPNLIQEIDHGVWSKKVRNGQSETFEKSSNWRTLSVCGERNARLICVRRDTLDAEMQLEPPNPSLVTIVPESIEEEKNVQPEGRKVELEGRKVELEGRNGEPEEKNVEPKEKNVKSQLNIVEPDEKIVKPEEKIVEPEEIKIRKTPVKRINRLSKSALRTVKPLAKAHVKSIVQGKIMQNQRASENPMYGRPSLRAPWKVIERLKENLFNKLLSTIVQEVQVVSVLESLYNMEFQ